MCCEALSTCSRNRLLFFVERNKLSASFELFVANKEIHAP